jgi:hypothetical protein
MGLDAEAIFISPGRKCHDRKVNLPESTTIPLYERGGLNFRPKAEKAKVRQCFNRSAYNRVQSTRFFGKQLTLLE